MRLALAFLALVAVAAPAKADAPRCMAMDNVRTVDRTGRISMQNGETIGPVVRIENDAKGLWLCADNHTCWPAADFDLVTPCAPEAMRGSIVKLR